MNYLWGGFAIYVADSAVFPVSNVSDLPVYGPTGTITGLADFRSFSSYTVFAGAIIGSNALFKGTGQAMQFKQRVDDYEELKGIAYRTVEGYSRGDYWNEDDGTRGDALINDGSVLFFTYAKAPTV